MKSKALLLDKNLNYFFFIHRGFVKCFLHSLITHFMLIVSPFGDQKLMKNAGPIA